MFEDTNQTQEIEMPENLFEETAEETELDVTEETPSNDTDSGDETPETKEESGKAEETPSESRQALKLKYNGEEKEIPLDEAVILAQKGMNYDYVKGRYDDVIGTITEYAKDANMSVENYLAYLKESRTNAYISNQIEELRTRYPDADDTLLREIADREIKLKEIDREKAEKEKSDAEHEAKRKPWENFFKEFPDVKPDSLDQAFYDAVNAGKTPREVYLERKLADLEEKITIEEKNKENQEKAIGSVKGDAKSKTTDAFLAGFLDSSY